jgi:hypothetical protein
MTVRILPNRQKAILLRHWRQCSCTLSAATAAVGLAILGVGCGFNPIQKPESKGVDAPVVSAQYGFSLIEQDKPREFTGSLLIWKPETTRADVQAISEATRASNQAYVERVEQVSAAFDGTFTDIDSAISEAQVQRDELAAESGVRDRLARLDYASRWFDSELAVLQERDAASDTVHARRLFERYCDAKLWQFATSVLLADGVFSQRPTPSAVCEPHFAARQYFEGADCSPAEGSARSYYACFWKALKLTSFVAVGPLNSSTHGPVLDAVGESEVFRQWFAVAAESGQAERPCGFFRSAISQFLRLAVVSRQPCTIPGTSVAFDLNVATDLEKLDATSPQRVSDAIERHWERRGDDAAPVVARATAELQFVPKAAEPRAGRTLSPVEAASDDIARKLGLMGTAKGKCGNKPLSLVDVALNLPFVQLERSPLDPDSCSDIPSVEDFPDLFVTDPELSSVESEITELKGERDRRLLAACLPFDTSVCTLDDADLDRPQCRTSRLKARQAQTAVSQAHLIRVFSLKLSPRVDNGQRWIEGVVNLGGKRPAAIGCMTGFADGVPVSCPDGKDGDAASVYVPGGMTLNYEPALEKLTVKMDLPASLLSVKELEAAPELVDLIQGTRMKVELFPNALGEKVPYLSGAAEFLRNGILVTRGVGSYLLEDSPQFSLERSFFNDKCSSLLAGR